MFNYHIVVSPRSLLLAAVVVVSLGFLILWLIFRTKRWEPLDVVEINIRIVLAIVLLCLTAVMITAVGIEGAMRAEHTLNRGPVVAALALANVASYVTLSPILLWRFWAVPGYFRAKFRLRASTDVEIVKLVEATSMALRLKRIPKVEESALGGSPFVYGRLGFGYRIVIPNGFDKYVGRCSVETAVRADLIRKFIIAHELSHIYHKDVVLTSWVYSVAGYITCWVSVTFFVSLASALVVEPRFMPILVFASALFVLVFLSIAPASRQKELLADGRASVIFSHSEINELSQVADKTSQGWLLSLERMLAVSAIVQHRFCALSMTSQVALKAQNSQDSGPSLSFQKILNYFTASHPSTRQREEALAHQTLLKVQRGLPGTELYSFIGASVVGVTFACVQLLASASLIITSISGQPLPGLNTARNLVLEVFFIPIAVMVGFCYLLPAILAREELGRWTMRKKLSQFGVRLGAFFLGGLLAALVISTAMGLSTASLSTAVDSMGWAIELLVPLFVLNLGFASLTLGIINMRLHWNYMSVREAFLENVLYILLVYVFGITMPLILWSTFVVSLTLIDILLIIITSMTVSLLLMDISAPYVHCLKGLASKLANLLPHNRLMQLIGSRQLLLDLAEPKTIATLLPLLPLTYVMSILRFGSVGSVLSLLAALFMVASWKLMKKSRVQSLSAPPINVLNAIVKSPCYGILDSEISMKLDGLIKKSIMQQKANNGGYFETGGFDPSVEGTYQALELLAVSNIQTDTRPSIAFLDTLKCPNGGFSSRRWLDPRLSTTYQGLRCVRLLGIPISDADRAAHTNWIMRRYVAKEGLFRSPERWRSSLQDTWFALESLDILGTLYVIDKARAGRGLIVAFSHSRQSLEEARQFARSLMVLGLLATEEVERLKRRVLLPFMPTLNHVEPRFNVFDLATYHDLLQLLGVPLNSESIPPVLAGRFAQWIFDMAKRGDL